MSTEVRDYSATRARARRSGLSGRVLRGTLALGRRFVGRRALLPRRRATYVSRRHRARKRRRDGLGWA